MQITSKNAALRESTKRSLRALVLLSTSVSVGAMQGCSFDISKLRPGSGSDASVEDVEFDVPTGDRVEIDAPSVTCRSLLDTTAGLLVGGSLVVAASTSGAASTMDPPMSCNANSHDAPEIIYEYQMRSAGKLVAFTDTANMGNPADCPRRFDTVVSIYRGTCGTPGMAVACNDDDTSAFNCAPGSSRTVATDLMAGQMMAISVDGYESNAGPFTLTLVENPLNELMPPMASNSCVCPRLVQAAAQNTVTLPLMMANDPGGGAVGGVFSMANNTLGGPRMIAPSSAKALAVELGFNVNDFAPTRPCATMMGAQAIFDLSIGGQVVRSFVVDKDTDILRTQRLPLRSLPDLTLGASTSILLRLRSITAGCRVGIATGNIFLRTGPLVAMNTDAGVGRDL